MLRILRHLFACIFIGIFMAATAVSSRAETTQLQGKVSPRTAGGTEYILAVSWQPGFCKTRPDRKECVSQTADRFDATHFALHGLWPVRKSYCGVDAAMQAKDKTGNWLDLPQLAVAGETASRLLVAMPGMQSGLERHQWLRSGTCQSGTAQDYFALQLHFLDRLNETGVQALFAGRLGSDVTEAEVKQAFDQSFGEGAGERVRMRCQKAAGRMVVTGLTIGLMGTLSSSADLGALIRAAGPTDFKCARGIVTDVANR